MVPFLTGLAWAAMLGAAPPDTHALQGRLLPLVQSHKGRVAIAVKQLPTGESYYLNADEPMSTASLVKLAVMIETYQQVTEGKIKLTDPIVVREQDEVPGSGVLTDLFSPGTTITLKDAVRLMICVSDNTATNLVLDKIGIPSTAQRMEAWGFANTKIHSKSFRRETSVFPERSKRFGLGSTTAREMVTLLEKLDSGKVANADSCKEMIKILKLCQDREKFPRYLPSSVQVAHKTGWVGDVSTDAGILYWPKGPVALCVLTAQNEDKRWAVDNAAHLLCAKVAKEVYEYFDAKPGAPVAGAKK